MDTLTIADRSQHVRDLQNRLTVLYRRGLCLTDTQMVAASQQLDGYILQYYHDPRGIPGHATPSGEGPTSIGTRY